jgi:signal transduction histidine kinase/ActR/RegA family two-component response regulator
MSHRLALNESGPRFDLDEQLRSASVEAIGPLALAVGALLAVCFGLELLHHTEESTNPALLAHVATVVLGLVGLARVAGRRPRWLVDNVYLVAVAIGLSITSAAVHLQALTGDPLDTLYVGEAVLAIGGLILATRWAVGAIVVATAMWAAFAYPTLSPEAFLDCTYALVSAGVVGVVLHAARRRTHARLAVLRYNEGVRKRELEAALGAAEANRADLDRRVDERTRALAQAYEDLQRELDERKRVEGERRVLADRLHQTQRMESIGRLAGGVAHDFNNLLSVIMGNAEIIVTEDELDDGVRESAQQIVEAAERAAGVTRQLLAFGRKQVIAPKVLSLRDVVDDLVRLVHRAIGEDVVLEVDVAADVSPVLADAGQLEQAMMNLVVNARDAMPTGGRLGIAVTELDVSADQAARFPGARPGPHVVLTVSDTGTGMDAATLASIWEPFFTTKAVGKGTGLGLPMVQGIVTQHGGFVDVVSAPGRGTRFEVYLPATSGTVRPARVKPVRLETPTGHETILVVEDEPQVRRLAVGALRQLGYQVLEAGDGESALAVARDHLGAIDLLLTDVVMPGMDGSKLAERLRLERPAIAVLFASGYDDSRIGKAGILPDHVDFLAKPYDLRTLGRRVREVIDHASGGSSGGWKRVSAG